MKVIARAKINLFLEVKGYRPDGFHEVETVLQSVDLRDELTFEDSTGVEVDIAWAPGSSGPIPKRPDLVERALLLTGTHARVQVLKSIPIGAGLGGGSADAASALIVAGNRGIGADELRQAARSLGTDVPFAMKGGTAIGRGRGDELEGIPSSRAIWWVLAVPAFGISTASVYARTGVSTARHKATALTSAIATGDAVALATLLHNDLEAAAFRLAPELEEIKRIVEDSGALASVMSGSGSAIAGICADEKDARACAATLRRSVALALAVPSTPVGAEVVGQ
ncbi:MAG TPA: 4-(cytidine 5'-diphospho)-2-C-methyl-D-erythritol kinase [Actinomycetota bacterium]|nr:4-(cytidine 5'-diphospho)-2-C-methyl-D-erythritol kinase [Actinomycetota bacterium]